MAPRSEIALQDLEFGAAKDFPRRVNAHPGPEDGWPAAIRQGRETGSSGRNAAWTAEMVMGVYRAALHRRRGVFPLTQRGHPLEG